MRDNQFKKIAGSVAVVLCLALWMPDQVLAAEEETPNPKDQTALSGSAFQPRQPGELITLRDAIHLALAANPDLKAVWLEVQAEEGNVMQAGLFPNPVLTLGSENFGGSGEFSGYGSVETTVQISQLIELGGKRSKREKVAFLDRDLAGWDYRSKIADVLNRVTEAFIGALASQELLALAEEQAALAAQVLETVSSRVRAGKVSPVEATKARVSQSTAQIAQEAAKRRLEAARKQLAAAWGSDTPLFKRVEGRLDVIGPLPSPEELSSLASQNPDIARWPTEAEKRAANLALEYARRVPDPTISFGTRRLNVGDDHAFVLAVSFPLPFFDRNQGGILAARRKLDKAEKDRESARVRFSTELAEAYESLSSNHSGVLLMREKVLPDAQAAFEATREGYRQGKFDYLDLLDSQRTLFEVKARYYEALAGYNRATAAIARLTGSGLKAYGLALNEELPGGSK